jgi:hypothetical protein
LGVKKHQNGSKKHPISERINDVAESYWRSGKLAVDSAVVAGHNPPVLLGTDQQAEKLQAGVSHSRSVTPTIQYKAIQEKR